MEMRQAADEKQTIDTRVCIAGVELNFIDHRPYIG